MKIGDWVIVPSLRKSGVIIKIERNHCRVAVGPMQIRCKLAELKPAPAPAQTKTPLKARFSSGPKPSEQIDLHGLSVQEAIARLDQWLNSVILAGYDRCRILHGLGSGKIQAAVHARLTEIQSVRSFKLDIGNPGVTVVYL